MIEKKDWENVKKQSEEQLKISLMGVEQFKSQIELCDRKLAEFQADPMPEEVKELVKELK